jgi:hypothetical protein
MSWYLQEKQLYPDWRTGTFPFLQYVTSSCLLSFWCCSFIRLMFRLHSNLVWLLKWRKHLYNGIQHSLTSQVVLFCVLISPAVAY